MKSAELFEAVDAKYRGCTNVFTCKVCDKDIFMYSARTKCEYNYCPWCGASADEYYINNKPEYEE